MRSSTGPPVYKDLERTSQGVLDVPLVGFLPDATSWCFVRRSPILCAAGAKKKTRRQLLSASYSWNLQRDAANAGGGQASRVALRLDGQPGKVLSEGLIRLSQHGCENIVGLDETRRLSYCSLPSW